MYYKRNDEIMNWRLMSLTPNPYKLLPYYYHKYNNDSQNSERNMSQYRNKMECRMHLLVRIKKNGTSTLDCMVEE